MGGLQGPSGEGEKLMYVGRLMEALRSESVPHAVRDTPPEQPVQGCPPFTGRGAGGRTAEKKRTHSPVGARTTIGSWENAGKTVSFLLKGVVSGLGDVA